MRSRSVRIPMIVLAAATSNALFNIKQAKIKQTEIDYLEKKTVKRLKIKE